jgi:hypothetical protein
VVNTLKFFRIGAVGFIVWLGESCAMLADNAMKIMYSSRQDYDADFRKSGNNKQRE